jgi:hypothetical protein
MQRVVYTTSETAVLTRVKEALPFKRHRTALIAGTVALSSVLVGALQYEGPRPKAPTSANIAPAPARLETKEPRPAQSEPQKPTEAGPPQWRRTPVRLNPKNFNKSQRALPGCANTIDLPNGRRIRSDKLSGAERRGVIGQKLTLAKAQLSPEGYKEFVPTIVDLTKVVPKKMSNYNGHFWPKGMRTPKLPQDIDNYVWHFTATQRSANNYNGEKFAKTMQNSGDLAVQFALNRSGKFSWLTKNRTYHVRSHNADSMGVEIAGACQEDIEPIQYRNGVYATVWFLTKNGYITKDTKSVEKVVQRVVHGHRELNPNGHSDMPGIVMSPVRGMVVNLLHDMGYGKPS